MIENSEIKERTAPYTSVGAEVRQSIHVSNDSITDETANFNAQSDDFEEMAQKISRLMDPSHLNTISMKELYDTVYEEKPPLIDGLLYPGTYLFVGSPKLGKSFLMAQLAYHISTGTPLWDYPVRKSKVLYLALEDSYRRIQKRLYQMFGEESAENLYFAVSAGQLGNGLDEQLQNFMRENPDTGLIIIDTLQKVRETGGDNYSYANDYEIITRLKHFADSYGITVIAVHHTRKQKADDKFDMISGTNGLLGAADGGFILAKDKRTSNDATLEISGRDQPDMKIYLNKNPERLIWELEHTETELWKEPPEPVLESIKAFLSAGNSSWSGSSTELTETLGVDMKANALTAKLNINAARLYNEYGIRYSYRRCHDGRKISLILEQRDDA